MSTELHERQLMAAYMTAAGHSPKQVAEQLGIHINTARNWLKSEKLKAKVSEYFQELNQEYIRAMAYERNEFLSIAAQVRGQMLNDMLTAETPAERAAAARILLPWLKELNHATGVVTLHTKVEVTTAASQALSQLKNELGQVSTEDLVRLAHGASLMEDEDRDADDDE